MIIEHLKNKNDFESKEILIKNDIKNAYSKKIYNFLVLSFVVNIVFFIAFKIDVLFFTDFIDNSLMIQNGFFEVMDIGYVSKWSAGDGSDLSWFSNIHLVNLDVGEKTAILFKHSFIYMFILYSLVTAIFLNLMMHFHWTINNCLREEKIGVNFLSVDIVEEYIGLFVMTIFLGLLFVSGCYFNQYLIFNLDIINILYTSGFLIYFVFVLSQIMKLKKTIKKGSITVNYDFIKDNIIKMKKIIEKQKENMDERELIKKDPILLSEMSLVYKDDNLTKGDRRYIESIFSEVSKIKNDMNVINENSEKFNNIISTKFDVDINNGISIEND